MRKEKAIAAALIVALGSTATVAGKRAQKRRNKSRIRKTLGRIKNI